LKVNVADNDKIDQTPGEESASEICHVTWPLAECEHEGPSLLEFLYSLNMENV